MPARGAGRVLAGAAAPVHAGRPARRATRRSRSPGSRSTCTRVPGHSPAHLAYATDGCLFSGDVLFAGSVGRTDLPGASWETLLESIRSLVDAYPPETVVYPGHGPATTLGAELARNPFLGELRAERGVTQVRGAARDV